MFKGLPLGCDIFAQLWQLTENAMRLCFLLVPEIVPTDLITKMLGG
jgi:hypothetical protein